MRALFAVVFFFLIAVASSADNINAPITIGLRAGSVASIQQAQTCVNKKSAPFFSRSLELLEFSSDEELLAAFASGRIDFASVSAFSYSAALQTASRFSTPLLRPIMRDGSTAQFSSIFINESTSEAASQSAFVELLKLQRSRIAVSHPTSARQSALVSAALSQQNAKADMVMKASVWAALNALQRREVDAASILFTDVQKSLAEALKADAGLSINETASLSRNKFRALDTPLIPYDPLVSGNNVPDELRAAMRTFLLNLPGEDVECFQLIFGRDSIGLKDATVLDFVPVAATLQDRKAISSWLQSVPIGSIHPTRMFVAAQGYPPKNFAAYGIVVFTKKVGVNDRERYLSVCQAYSEAIDAVSTIRGRPEDQMVTVWPVESEGVANRLQFETDEKDCDVAVDNYSLETSIKAINDARLAGAHIRGRGPFIIAWAPGNAKGLQDVPILLFDLSAVEDKEEISEMFVRWRDKISSNPIVWKDGWHEPSIIDQVLLFTSRNGELILKLWSDK